MKAKPRLRVIGTNNRDGFTLVELIVVLVILAILAALLIPSLTGYIEKARQKQIIMQTRQAVMAAQTLFDEVYASDLSMSTLKCDDVLSLPIGKNKKIKDQIYELAELDDNKGIIDVVKTNSKGKISTLTWSLNGKDGKDGMACTYDIKNADNPYTIISGGPDPDSE